MNVCKFYADGQCTRGENCSFPHRSEEAAAEYARECKRTKNGSRGSNSDK
jgi:methylphosphotriester-DNA--protein-cysteine methyltransferase